MSDEFPIKYLLESDKLYIAENDGFDSEKLENDINLRDICFFRIDEVCSEEESPRKAALENVLSAMKIKGINIIFMIMGDKNGVNFYFGVSKDLSYNENLVLDINDIGESILKPSIQGNFRGSRVSDVDGDAKRKIIETIDSMKYNGALEGVPGTDKDNEEFQGVDRLVDIMLGDEFVFMVLAQPMDLSEIIDIQNKIYLIYSKLVPLAKKTIQEGSSTNENNSTNTTKGETITDGTSNSIQVTNGTSSSEQEGTSKSISKGTNNSTSNNSGNKSTSSGGSESVTTGDNNSKTSGTSTSKGETTGVNKSNASSVNTSVGTSTGTGKSESVSREFADKGVQDWIKYFDEIILPRIDYGKGKGTFISLIAMFTNNKASLHKLLNTSSALYSGESGNRVPLRPVKTDKNAIRSIKSFQLPRGQFKKMSTNELLSHIAMSQVIQKNGSVLWGNWITTNELGVIAGLPKKEVVGMGLRKEVEFGLNIQKDVDDNDKIELGHMVQSGNVLNNKVYLDKKVLDQHIFISGVTGSGKTTTCQKILLESKIPFLVIEPAKTEYRILKNDQRLEDVLIFTLGKDDVAPFRMNPFVFFKHENISSRVDMIKACIEAAFDMEAAIPQIIETALYKSYAQYGWNISTNTNSMFDDPFADNVKAFPTMSDLINNTVSVVKEQGFDDRLKNDYIGSIRARLQGLVVGAKGKMLDTHKSIDFEELLEHNVIFELEEVRSGSEKSLIMGFILINLMEAIKAKYLKTGKFRHMTLVEEAHRLLSKYQPGDCPNKRHGVEMFADMLAEIRKYGESLIIVDQIPNKLTSEVLKNTNTKIIHRIFAEDDKEAIGNTIMLDKEQKEFLSNLQAGRAIYFTSGTQKAIQVQIAKSSDTSEKAPEDSELVDGAMKYYCQRYESGIIEGTELFDEIPTPEMAMEVKTFFETDVVSTFLYDMSQGKVPSEKNREKVKIFADKYGMNFIAKYILKYSDKLATVICDDVPENRLVELISLGLDCENIDSSTKMKVKNLISKRRV